MNKAFAPLALLSATGLSTRSLARLQRLLSRCELVMERSCLDAADMKWRDEAGSCFSSIAPAQTVGGVSLMFLGASFMKNVVAVFDLGQNQMRFAARHAQAGEQPNATRSAPGRPTGSASASTSIYTGTGCRAAFDSRFGWLVFRAIAAAMLSAL